LLRVADIHICTEKVKLLMENRRREGIWDINLAGKMAARGMENEEEGFRL
jgi:hypothetical protein